MHHREVTMRGGPRSLPRALAPTPTLTPTCIDALGWMKLGDAAMHVWETMGHKALQQWKSVWDEYDKLSAQYSTVITPTLMAMVLDRLDDIGPEQLTFGSLGDGKGYQPENPPSLQDFIRGRMQEHFEMVDKYGFGSFQELITTAEEAMCEIWVASLDIIESDRYQR
ncbi:hypothetical protein RSAG8_02828, partial [Rhizoctonia solani AG-8 WAC10335]